MTTPPLRHARSRRAGRTRRHPIAAVAAPAAGAVAAKAAGAAAALLLTACGHTAHARATPATGTVTGDLSLCYGPGPDHNLRPLTTVEARRNGTLVATGAFRTDTKRHGYRLELAPGEYALRMRGFADVRVTVRAGETTVADPVTPGCV